MERVIAYLKDAHTRDAVVKTIAENISYYQRIDTEDKIQNFTGLFYNQFVFECVQDNQYVSLSNETIEKINGLYKDLILQLRKLHSSKITISHIEDIVIIHRRRLIKAIEENNFKDHQAQVCIPCAEYTGEFQKKILRMTAENILEPVLDVGCGKQYALIRQLVKMGYAEVYGLDQYVNDDPRIICSNWFDYDFRPRTWGTIIAHMSFTNHFRRALIIHQEDREIYKKKYQEILESLVVKGRFIYSPSIRKEEEQIDRGRFHIEYYENTEDSELDTVCIQRLS